MTHLIFCLNICNQSWSWQQIVNSHKIDLRLKQTELNTFSKTISCPSLCLCVQRFSFSVIFSWFIFLSAQQRFSGAWSFCKDRSILSEALFSAVKWAVGSVYEPWLELVHSYTFFRLTGTSPCSTANNCIYCIQTKKRKWLKLTWSAFYLIIVRNKCIVKRNNPKCMCFNVPVSAHANQ